MTELQVLSPGDWRIWRDLRLQALAEAPYAFGSKLVDWQGDNDREERWRQRLESVPYNVAVSVDGRYAGMASGVPTDRAGVAELISMWVSPAARGRGVGDLLVSCVADWARGTGARQLILNVKVDNPAATALYRRSGFVLAGPADHDPDRDDDEETMIMPLDSSTADG
jgi:ribosomal protein S18 acetylase RimI-like enzyme